MKIFWCGFGACAAWGLDLILMIKIPGGEMPAEWQAAALLAMIGAWALGALGIVLMRTALLDHLDRSARDEPR